MKNAAAPIPFAPFQFNEVPVPQHRSPLESRTNIETALRCNVAGIEIINGSRHTRDWMRQKRKGQRTSVCAST